MVEGSLPAASGSPDTDLGQRVLRLLVDSVVDYAVFVLDTEGRILTWNAGAARLKGYTAKEAIGRSFAIFYPPEDVASGKPRRELETAARDGRTEDEGWRVRKDGTRFWASVLIVALRDERGQLAGFGKITRDLTRRRHAEENALRLAEARAVTEAGAREARAWEQLAAEQSRYAERAVFLARASEVLNSTLDPEAILKSLAQLAVPSMGDWCSVEVVEGDNTRTVAVAHVDPEKVRWAWELSRRFPPDRSAPRGVYQVIRTGKAEWYPEIPEALLREAAPDDERMQILRELGLRSGITVPIVARGTPLGAITLIWAESQRNYDQTDLDFAVEVAHRAGLAMENARLYQDVTRAVRVRDDFLAVAGHELRTPLAAVLMHIEAMKRAVHDDPAARRFTERLDRTEKSARRLERLMGEMLDVSRITSGRLALEPEPVDLTELALEVAGQMADAAEGARCKVTLKLAPAVHGECDRLRMAQVLTNLLGNAIKYGQGKPVELELFVESGQAVVRVTDHGIGIAAEEQQRIFDRFERAVTNREYGGFGLGLWIARQIVEASGGRIEVRSTPGDGAAFTVTLPLQPPAG